MIKFEHEKVIGWEHAILGMRNPMNSWEKSDSKYGCQKSADGIAGEYECGVDCTFWYECHGTDADLILGSNDLDLMKRLRNAGTDHRKFMRMIAVYIDITAPLYWWKEFDTYKVGTVANSCSTMHKIHAEPITLKDFSIDNFNIDDEGIDLWDCFINVVADCELLRQKYLETKDKKYWRGLIQLLPSSYNQKRTVMLNYEVLANIYKSRKDHKLDEWRDFCGWIESLPYSSLITGKDEAHENNSSGQSS